VLAQLASAIRIHIIGGPAAGKSTLARRLGAVLDLPVHELDKIAFEGRDFQEQPLARRVAAVREIAASPRWVTEGIFLDWTDPLLKKAEVIIWLDNGAWRHSALRTLLRTIRGALREARKRRGPKRFLRVGDYVRNLKMLTRVIRASRGYWSPTDGPLPYPVTRDRTAQQLASHADKVLHIRDRRGAAELPALIASRHTVVAP
jgi:hypothetical protein